MLNSLECEKKNTTFGFCGRHDDNPHHTGEKTLVLSYFLNLNISRVRERRYGIENDILEMVLFCLWHTAVGALIVRDEAKT